MDVETLRRGFTELDQLSQAEYRVYGVRLALID